MKILKEQLKRRFGQHYQYELASNTAEALEILEELDSQAVQVGQVSSTSMS